ncbi:MAG: leucine-rich repeat protein, partial [Bacteroidaceae bacterium]|nr:leucine-rich repeat protein [Bacteroidaceae bacterium]
VTEIGYSAFSGCKSLTSISIPPLVTMIGDYAFLGCSSLTSISIPEVCEVEENTFLDCPENLVITRY